MTNYAQKVLNLLLATPVQKFRDGIYWRSVKFNPEFQFEFHRKYEKIAYPILVQLHLSWTSHRQFLVVISQRLEVLEYLFKRHLAHFKISLNLVISSSPIVTSTERKFYYRNTKSNYTQTYFWQVRKSFSHCQVVLWKSAEWLSKNEPW